MNPLYIFLTLLIGSAGHGKGKLIIVVEGISHETGTLMIGLFDNAADFTVNPVMSIMESVNKKGS